MALIGNLIKKGIALNSMFTGGTKTPARLQREVLKKLISEAQDTAFGIYYGFSELLEREDLITGFKQRVPIHDYDEMHRQWWNQQHQYPDITWPGKPAFFALSSGTTGKASKRIPITEAFLQSMRDVGISLIRSLPNYDFPEELFESEVLMLSSSANLAKSDEGHLKGEISGINVRNFPGWYDFFYRPGKEIARIDNWDDRVEAIARKAPEWNIGAIAGIPSWVLLMIRKVMEVHGLDTIHDIWPNLTVYASGGVAFETYRKDFEEISARPLVIMDTYLASEGFFAYTARPGPLDMRLAIEHGYFYEFIPFDERGVDERGKILEEPVSLHIDEVVTGQDYVLVISTCAGAWRYVIGDTIRFTSLDPPEILITGRTKFFLNVVGSQLSEEKLDAAILDVSGQMGIKVNEYAVAAIRNEENAYIHQWVIVTDKPGVDEGLCAEKLDAALQEANKNYKVARKKALKGVQVLAISKEMYHNYLEENRKKGGQVKTLKVMKSEKMEEYLKFIRG